MVNQILFVGLGAIGAILILGAVALVMWNRRSKQNVSTKFIGLRATSMQARPRDGIARGGKFLWKEPGGLEADVLMDGGFNYDSPDGKLVLVDLDTYHPIKLDEMKPEELELVVNGPVQFLAERGSDKKPADQVATLTTQLHAKRSAILKSIAWPDWIGENEDAMAARLKSIIDGTEPKSYVRALVYRGDCANDADPVKALQKDGTYKLIPPVWRRLAGDILARYRKDQRWAMLNNIGGALWLFLQRATPFLMIFLIIVVIVFGAIIVSGMR